MLHITFHMKARQGRCPTCVQAVVQPCPTSAWTHHSHQHQHWNTYHKVQHRVCNYVQNNLGQVPARIIKSLTPLLLDTLDTRPHDTILHHVTSHDSTHAEDAVQVRRLHEEGVLLFLATLEKLLRVLLVQHCAGVVHLKTAQNTNR